MPMAIRTRLLELHERLKVDFPVYVLFTKADLIAGFIEYFGSFDEADAQGRSGARRSRPATRTANMVGEVPAEFDAAGRRASDR